MRFKTGFFGDVLHGFNFGPEFGPGRGRKDPQTSSSRVFWPDDQRKIDGFLGTPAKGHRQPPLVVQAVAVNQAVRDFADGFVRQYLFCCVSSQSTPSSQHIPLFPVTLHTLPSSTTKVNKEPQKVIHILSSSCSQLISYSQGCSQAPQGVISPAAGKNAKRPGFSPAVALSNDDVWFVIHGSKTSRHSSQESVSGVW